MYICTYILYTIDVVIHVCFWGFDTDYSDIQELPRTHRSYHIVSRLHLAKIEDETERTYRWKNLTVSRHIANITLNHTHQENCKIINGTQSKHLLPRKLTMQTSQFFLTQAGDEHLVGWKFVPGWNAKWFPGRDPARDGLFGSFPNRSPGFCFNLDCSKICSIYETKSEK